MKEITIASVFLRMLLEGARRRNLDYAPILLRHGVSSLGMEPGTATHHAGNDNEQFGQQRLPLDVFAAIAIDLMVALDDESMGLADRAQRLGSFNMACRACISAKNIKRSLKRYANFWNLFDNTFLHEVVVQDDMIIYRLHQIPGQQLLNEYMIDAVLSSVHRFHCWLAGQFIPLSRVALRRSQPAHAREYNGLYYGSQIDFAQAYDQLEIVPRYTNLDIVQTPDTLDQYLLGTNLSLLYQPKNYRIISDQVRQWLEKNIRQGNYQATLKQAARHFQMSQQVLHRRLQAENLSFKDIKMQTRRDIAINLLFSDKYKIEDIATRVGFSEPSAFIRAFKSWTGTTPLSYRQENR